LRIGIPKEYTVEGIEEPILAAFHSATERLKGMGAEIESVSLPHTRYAIAAYYIIATAEASSNLARYDGVKYGLRVQDRDLLGTYERTRSLGFGKEVKRRIMLGTYALSSGYYEAYYLKAMKVRTLIRDDFFKAFKGVDVVMAPVSPVPVFKIGEKVRDPLSMYLVDAFTTPVNLSGLPAIALPCERHEGLPIGIQFIGRPFEEGTILQVADAFEGDMERPHGI
jgi:aspartyl-tRNA(Asn)/glutamyl-tRNA(Gln) amidotransferase subunit A